MPPFRRLRGKQTVAADVDGAGAGVGIKSRSGKRRAGVGITIFTKDKLFVLAWGARPRGRARARAVALLINIRTRAPARARAGAFVRLSAQTAYPASTNCSSWANMVVLHDRVRLQESSRRYARESQATAFLNRVLEMLDLEGQEVDISKVGNQLFWLLEEHRVLKTFALSQSLVAIRPKHGALVLRKFDRVS
jgi:hypothetical protein